MATDGRRRARLGVGAAIALILVIAAITVAAGVVRTVAVPAISVPRPAASFGDVADPAEDGDIEGAPVGDGAELYIHVAGAVERPGLYRLPAGARVVDAVAAAGGFGGDADPAAVNLARTLSDGEQLVILRVGEAPDIPPGAAPGVTSGTAADAPVDLNTADAAALDTLPRIGPALAERILQWREENGRFTSVEDLLAVPGIGEKLLAGLRDRVRV